MNKKYLFCLSGCGYLKDIVQKSGRVIALIQVMTYPDKDTMSKDEVWINCEVNDLSQQACLKHIFALVRAGQDVILTFKAEYSAFINASACLAPEDPDHIVTLQSKLQVLEDCYINGRSAEINHHKLKAVVEPVFQA